MTSSPGTETANVLTGVIMSLAQRAAHADSAGVQIQQARTEAQKAYEDAGVHRKRLADAIQTIGDLVDWPTQPDGPLTLEMVVDRVKDLQHRLATTPGEGVLGAQASEIAQLRDDYTRTREDLERVRKLLDSEEAEIRKWRDSWERMREILGIHTEFELPEGRPADDPELDALSQRLSGIIGGALLAQDLDQFRTFWRGLRGVFDGLVTPIPEEGAVPHQGVVGQIERVIHGMVKNEHEAKATAMAAQQANRFWMEVAQHEFVAVDETDAMGYARAITVLSNATGAPTYDQVLEAVDWSVHESGLFVRALRRANNDYGGNTLIAGQVASIIPPRVGRLYRDTGGNVHIAGVRIDSALLPTTEDDHGEKA